MSVGLVDGALHAARDGVAVEDGLAVDIAGGATDGLYQGAVGTEETLLVGIEDSHQRHFGEVEALTQEVDAHQHIEDPHAEVAHNLDALEGVDIGMDVFAADAEVDEV